MTKNCCIVWFRRDLRLHDNPAWNAALSSGYHVIPVFIHCDSEEGRWRRGSASNWWLHHALNDLSKQLDEHGFKLIIRKTSSSATEMATLCQQTSPKAVFWNRCYEEQSVRRDSAIKKSLSNGGINVETFNGNLLFDPLKVLNKSNAPYRVFTPFWKFCLSLGVKKTITVAPTQNQTPTHKLTSTPLEALQLLPTTPWDCEMKRLWQPTRLGAEKLLQEAIDKSSHYLDLRDIPAEAATSQLSAYLHFGQISPAEFHHTLTTQSKSRDTAELGILRQLYWREFSAHLLYHFPHTHSEPLRNEYQSFPWDLNPEYLEKWQRGRTGFPIIDAGMRQLWKTGWMHNRVRMIVSSFLVKHLLQPWQEGAHWFWDTLVDADLANNTQGWQWIAGCGADASPYFRVFNPILQSQKFDPSGNYIKNWLPELRNLPVEFIHTPWKTPPLELATAGVSLGVDYPYPIISHERGRKQALEAYKTWKGQ